MKVTNSVYVNSIVWILLFDNITWLYVSLYMLIHMIMSHRLCLSLYTSMWIVNKCVHNVHVHANLYVYVSTWCFVTQAHVYMYIVTLLCPCVCLYRYIQCTCDYTICMTLYNIIMEKMVNRVMAKFLL